METVNKVGRGHRTVPVQKCVECALWPAVYKVVLSCKEKLVTTNHVTEHRTGA